MRVAVLADIHGNLPALDAVLVDVGRAGVDAVVLLGHMALGPMPVQTLDRLVALADRAVWVRGDCEREMVSSFDGADDPGDERAEMTRRSAELLDRAHRDLLDGLQLAVTLDVDGLGPTLFCGHPGGREDDRLRRYRDADAWAQGYVLRRYSDTQALEAFTEQARRRPFPCPSPRRERSTNGRPWLPNHIRRTGRVPAEHVVQPEMRRRPNCRVTKTGRRVTWALPTGPLTSTDRGFGSVLRPRVHPPKYNRRTGAAGGSVIFAVRAGLGNQAEVLTGPGFERRQRLEARPGPGDRARSVPVAVQQIAGRAVRH